MAKGKVNGVTVDYDRDELFDPLGIQRLKESYMMDSEKSPQERFAYVSSKFASNPEHAQRLYEYSSKHWLSYSTPILSYGRSKKGMPISCFLNYIWGIAMYSRCHKYITIDTRPSAKAQPNSFILQSSTPAGSSVCVAVPA